MPGPPRTPTAVLEQRGSWRANQRKREPKPRLGTPRAPQWFDAEQKRVWRAMTKELSAMGVLSLVDGWALARYVTFFVRWAEAEQRLRSRDAEGLDLLSEDGRRLSRMARHISEQMTKIEDRFGLTPAARARLTSEGPVALDAGLIKHDKSDSVVARQIRVHPAAG